MFQLIMTFVFLAGIAGLFALDRDKKAQPSMALWIPVAWLFINCSRPVSYWLSIFGLANSVPDTGTGYLEGSPIDASVFMFLLIAGIVVLAARSERVSPLLRRMGAILLYFSFCLLSVLWSDFPFVAFKHWSKGIGDVVMVLVLLTDPEPLAALKRLFNRVGFVVIPLSVLFVKYYPLLGRGHNNSGVNQYTGVATQKNALGMICVVFGFASLWRFLTAYRNREADHRTQLLIAHGVILAMALWLLRTADAMSAFSSFLMGALIMTLLTNRRTLLRRPLLAHILVATMVGITLFAIFFDSSGGMLETLGRNSTLTGRTAIWQAVLSLAGSPLFGTGYESFWEGGRLQMFWTIEQGAFRGIQEAHNGYIEVFLNLGWIGIVLLAGVIITAYRRAIATLSQDPYAGSLGLAFFVAAITFNLTEAGFRMMFPLWIFLLLVAIGVPKALVPETSYGFSPDFPEPLAANEPRGNYAFRKKATQEFAMQRKGSAVVLADRGSSSRSVRQRAQIQQTLGRNPDA